jgi:hypothetical protein
MISTLFGWFWLVLNISIAWFALKTRRNFFVRSLVVGGAMLGAAAGLANGLVMSLNGMQMPVERSVDWGDATSFFSDSDDIDSCWCRLYRRYDPPVDPWNPDDGVHVDVPAPPPPPLPGQTAVPTDPEAFSPTLRFLDDRHPFVVCGETTLFSKGDIMGALGVILLVPGLLLALAGLVIRKIFRKRNAPTDR